jgi:predicted DNA-binding ribbon-helix-helix protein
MIRKHSITLHGHRTSLSLEDEFWTELTAIAATRAIPLAGLISEIDDNRDADSNLSSALRLHVLAWLKSMGAAPSPNEGQHKNGETTDAGAR